MKKKLLMACMLMISLQSAFAAKREYAGYLKSGDGFCTLKFNKSNDYLYELIYTSNEMTVRATNIELENGFFMGFDEPFDRKGDYYEQLFFDIPIYPKTYRIKVKALGDGRFFIEKKTSIFGQVSFKSSDVCITKY